LGRLILDGHPHFRISRDGDNRSKTQESAACQMGLSGLQERRDGSFLEPFCFVKTSAVKKQGGLQIKADRLLQWIARSSPQMGEAPGEGCIGRGQLSTDPERVADSG